MRKLIMLQYRMCHYCGAYDPSKRCAWCKSVRYCNSTCQRKDWNQSHNHDCAHVAKHRFFKELDSRYAYFISTHGPTKIPFKRLNVPYLVGSAISADLNEDLKVSVFAWHGLWYQVMSIAPLTTNRILQTGNCLQDPILVTCNNNKCRRPHVNYKFGSAAFSNSFTSNDLCECQTEIVFTWLKVCQRLENTDVIMFPVEIRYMIADYVCADTRLCKLVRHKIFPFTGLPNIYY